MKRNALIAAACVCTLLWAVCAAAAPVGYVQEAVGDARILCADESVKVAAEKMPVQESDTLITGQGSRMQVMFTDRSVLALGEDSELKVYSVMSQFGSGMTSLGMLKGTMRVITGKVVSENPDKFLVESPLGVIGIRGTEFASLVDGERETHALLEGGPVVYTTTQNLGGDYSNNRKELCAKAFDALESYQEARELYDQSGKVGSKRRMEGKIRDLRAIMYENKCVAP